MTVKKYFNRTACALSIAALFSLHAYAQDVPYTPLLKPKTAEEITAEKNKQAAADRALQAKAKEAADAKAEAAAAKQRAADLEAKLRATEASAAQQTNTKTTAAETEAAKLKRSNADLTAQLRAANAKAAAAEEKAAKAKAEAAQNTKPAVVASPIAVATAPTIAHAEQPTVGTAIEAYSGGPKLIVLPKATASAKGTLLGNTSYEDEKPLYQVRVPYNLAIGETAITHAQWEACVADRVCSAASDAGFGRGDRPVINVSWNDINQKYLPWLNKKTGATGDYAYRLPTEAEREYATRAGGDGEFSLGRNNNLALSAATANYDANYQYKNSLKGEYRAKTVAVKTFEPNVFGLYEMHGNVWEWCDDYYDANAYKARQGANGWLASTKVQKVKEEWRVLRGGSWSVNPDGLRSANRYYGTPDYAGLIIGFRLARTLP